jgi:phosphoenolpyruvate-protein phosphotransferase
MSSALDLKAPLSGAALPLTQVPDPVFAGLMMGDGLAIRPTSGVLLAPCDGIVTQIARTQHALTLTADNGAQILMHIGIDTVSLKGKGFVAKVREGERVHCGMPLIEADFSVIEGQVPSLDTMLVIANSDDYAIGFKAQGDLEAGVTRFLAVVPRAQFVDATPAASGGPSGESSREALVGHGDGLHARPAALIQHAAKPFSAQVHIEFNGQQANARSVVALMGLGVGHEDRVRVIARGEDAEQALAAVIEALQMHSASAGAEVAAIAPPVASVAAGKMGGVCAAPGCAIGQVVQLSASEPAVDELAEDAGREYDALAKALAAVRHGLADDMHAALKRGDKQMVSIIDAHLALLDDPELIGAAERAIGRGKSAGFAFREAARAQRQILAATGNALLAERASDLKDIERQVLLAITGEEAPLPELYANSILVADDLTPSELNRLPAGSLAGVVLARGGATSHVAILVRARGIPALVAAGSPVLALAPGKQVLLDASNGWLDPAPDDAELEQVRTKIQARDGMLAGMRAQAGQPAVTQDGITIEVVANIANEHDAREAVRHGADGVGLLRSEFLFIDRTAAPSRAEQQTAYQAVLDALEGRTAIMRTLDVGGDKEVPYLTLPAEENPALGLRGVRSGFACPDMLDDQLAALLAVRPAGSLRILLPMVADVSDLLRVKRRVEALAAEAGLTELPQVGVMIEVPSAALLADQLACHADFLSIGTNDLTQYTLAMDRCHPQLAARLDPLHPALLRLIGLAAEGAARHGRWIGVCGAMASDLDAVPVLLGLGITELSVSPGLIPELKARVRALDVNQCRTAVQSLLPLTSAEEVRARVREIWPQA